MYNTRIFFRKKNGLGNGTGTPPSGPSTNTYPQYVHIYTVYQRVYGSSDKQVQNSDCKYIGWSEIIRWNPLIRTPMGLKKLAVQ